jgi:hypothetical protein
MTDGGYSIRDEPQSGPLSAYAVNPMWPLLAVMFAGAWLGWVWFAFNAVALGTPTRRQEHAIVGVAFTATAAFAVALRLALLVITVWKLGLSYALYLVQRRTFHIYEYYGGAVRNGLGVVIAGAIVGRPLVMDLIDSMVWRIIVSGGVPGS